MKYAATTLTFAMAILAILIASFAPEGAHAWVKEPNFCHGINCPNFTTVANCSDFEIRNYPSAMWVSVEFEGPGTTTYEESVQHGFMHLFRYITGANAKHEKVDMTAPVLNKVIPGASPTCNSTFVISFFVPYVHQNNAPQPSDAKVYLRRQPELHVAVRTFGGWVSGWTQSVVPELQLLGSALQKANIKFSQSEEWIAQYNGPFTILDRHNEVWYPISGGLENFQC